MNRRGSKDLEERVECAALKFQAPLTEVREAGLATEKIRAIFRGMRWN